MSFAPLEFLFPTPSLPKSALSPSHFPGISPESTQTLKEVLKDNHLKWHIFFNEKRFHNHAAHRAIAAWALGAKPSEISSGYKKDCNYEKPAIKSPHPITREIFNDHLGDDQYYSAYVQFFTDHVREKGIADTFEQFVLSRKANIGSDSKQPWMLTRFLSGVLHPMIHTGYGAEFGLPGMIVEGLAMTAVQECPENLLNRLSLFEDTGDKLQQTAHNASGTLRHVLNATSTIVDKVLPSNMQLDTGEVPVAAEKKPSTCNALSLLSRVLSDKRFAPTRALKESENTVGDTIKSHGNEIAAYTNQWDVNESHIDKKIEELVWTVCVLYGVAGWTDEKQNQGFTADFFLMHLVTSSIFLPALCAILPASSQVRLLKAYLHVVLVLAVARGQPDLDIKGFVQVTHKPENEFLPDSVNAMKHLDMWMRVIEEAQAHHDEHVTKTIRALAGWTAAFGSRKPRAKPGERRMSKDADLHPRVWRESMNGNPAYSPRTRSNSNTSENELGVALDSRDDSKVRSEVEKQGEDADLHPRAWRESLNGKDGIKTDNHLHQSTRKDPATSTGAADISQSWSKSQPQPQSQPTLPRRSSNEEDDGDFVPYSELPGSEFLDGGLFLRIGVLTLNRMGWDKEAEHKKPGNDKDEEEFWDFKGFFDKNKNVLKAKF